MDAVRRGCVASSGWIQPPSYFGSVACLPGLDFPVTEQNFQSKNIWNQSTHAQNLEKRACLVLALSKLKWFHYQFQGTCCFPEPCRQVGGWQSIPYPDPGHMFLASYRRDKKPVSSHLALRSLCLSITNWNQSILISLNTTVQYSCARARSAIHSFFCCQIISYYVDILNFISLFLLSIKLFQLLSWNKQCGPNTPVI